MKCDRCNKEIVKPEGCGTGYATNEHNETICYECCAEEDREWMRTHDKIDLYLTETKVEDRWKWSITNWPGTLRFDNLHVRQGYHNIAGVRRDTWIWFEGRRWHGVRYGDNTQVVHLKKLKKRPTD